MLPRFPAQTPDTFSTKQIAPNSLLSHPSEHQTATPHPSPISHQLCLTSSPQSSRVLTARCCVYALGKATQMQVQLHRGGMARAAVLIASFCHAWSNMLSSKVLSDVHSSRACGKLIGGAFRRQRDRLSKPWRQEHRKTIPPSPP